MSAKERHGREKAAERPSDRNRSIIQRFKAARSDLNVTQEECAARLGISPAALRSYEILRTPLPCDVALRFCWCYLVDERWLATGDGDWRPCVGLAAASGIIAINQREGFGEVFDLKIASMYRALLCEDFQEKYSRLVALSSGDVERMRLVMDYLINSYEAAAGSVKSAAFVGAMIRGGLSFLKEIGVSLVKRHLSN